MQNNKSRTKIYLKRACPFCLKLRIFLTEAGIADRYDVIVFDDGDETHKALRQRMDSAGQKPSFPAAEAGSGALATGTDELIARFAAEAGVDAHTMPLLSYYESGVFSHHIAMYRELQHLKAGPNGKG